MSDLEIEHLQVLMEIRSESRRYLREYDEKLEDFVLRLRDSGCSTRVIAEALNVGHTTVQNWATNAAHRRDQNN